MDRKANKRRNSKKNGKKGKLSTNRTNEFRDDLGSKNEYTLNEIESQTMQGDENRKQSLVGKKEPQHTLNSKEAFQENEWSKQSLNNERSSSFAAKKPFVIEEKPSVESLNPEKAMPPGTKKPHLLENESSEHSQHRKKPIVHPFKGSYLLENKQSEHSQHGKSSITSTSKKLSFDKEPSEESIRKKKSVSSPRKKSRSFETVSSDEALQTDKSKSKKKKARHSSDDNKKHNLRKTRKDKSRKKKRRDSESQHSDVSDSSREPTPPVVIVDWSRHCKSMEQKVKKAIKSQKVVVFAKKETDPNIDKVKSLMAQYCVTYGLVELDDSPYFEAQLYNMTCCRCLPLIFIDGMFLGSLFELKTLEGMGRMKELLSKKVRKH